MALVFDQEYKNRGELRSAIGRGDEIKAHWEGDLSGKTPEQGEFNVKGSGWKDDIIFEGNKVKKIKGDP